uniref:Uncharacterized protein n=1 Tax=Dicentrarchus labrax TaxID=13489 RepID=A0A8P4FV56_DICLA
IDSTVHSRIKHRGSKLLNCKLLRKVHLYSRSLYTVAQRFSRMLSLATICCRGTFSSVSSPVLYIRTILRYLYL